MHITGPAMALASLLSAVSAAPNRVFARQLNGTSTLTRTLSPSISSVASSSPSLTGNSSLTGTSSLSGTGRVLAQPISLSSSSSSLSLSTTTVSSLSTSSSVATATVTQYVTVGPAPIVAAAAVPITRTITILPSPFPSPDKKSNDRERKDKPTEELKIVYVVPQESCPVIYSVRNAKDEERGRVKAMPQPGNFIVPTTTQTQVVVGGVTTTLTMTFSLTVDYSALAPPTSTPTPSSSSSVRNGQALAQPVTPIFGNGTTTVRTTVSTTASRSVAAGMIVSPSAVTPSTSSSTSSIVMAVGTPLVVASSSPAPAPAPASSTSAAAPQASQAPPSQAPPAQAAPAPAPAPAGPGTPIQQNTLQASTLGTHNTDRAQHSAPSLTYDPTLASYAQSYANGCVFAHSGGPYGENLAIGYGSPQASIDAWFQERTLYDYNNPGFSPATGHFTQMVWVGTTRIGCGYASCPNGDYLVCEYAPPGNVIGQFAQNVNPPLF